MENKLIITLTKNVVNVHFVGQINRGDFISCNKDGFKSIGLIEDNIPRIVGRTLENPDKKGNCLVAMV